MMPPEEYLLRLSKKILTTTPTDILTTDPHHLYYLLIKFDQLNLIGSTPLHEHSTNTNYLPIHWSTHPTTETTDRSDATSLFSNLSITTTTSTLWNSTLSPLVSTILSTPQLLFPSPNTQRPSLSTQQDQLKFIYSTFTKLPSLCLTPSSTPANSLQRTIPTKVEPMQLIQGFSDLPNQHLVPLNCFKSLWSIYLQDLDPRIFSGWLQLSQNLRKLEIRKTGLEDLEHFLVDAILDEIKRDRKREQDRINVAAEQQQSSPPSETTTTTTTTISQPTQYESDSLPPEFPTLSWAFLQHLCLADNAFTFLPTKPLRALSSLVSLDLSSNLLIAVPNGLQALPRLKLLNLSDNMIDSVLGIYHLLPNITTMNLSRNRLTSLCGIENLKSLERIDVRSNQIQDQGEISRLATLPKLTHLWTSDNPFCNLNHDWRTCIFNYFVLENRSVDRVDTSDTSDTTPSVNLVLDNHTPTHSERKGFVKLPSSQRIDASSVLVQVKKTTVVKSPDRHDNNKRARHHLPPSEASSTSHHQVNNNKKLRVRKHARIIDLDTSLDGGPKVVLNGTLSPSPPPRPQHPRSVSSDPSHLSFRKRVEALRLELGDDSWLTVLSESEFPVPDPSSSISLHSAS